MTNNHGNSDCWIVKTDVVGNIQWQKSYGGSLNDVANSIQQTTDGGYITAGYASSSDGDVTGNHGNGDYWVVKTDASGNMQWQKALGGSDFDRANSVLQTTDGGYIVAGFSYSNNGDVTGNHGNADYWIVKLDASGNIQWQKAIGGSNYEEPYLHSIQQTTDGGYIIGGFTYSNNGDITANHGNADYWIVKLNAAGNIQWQKTLGGSQEDIARSIQQTSDGGYVVAGNSYSNNGDVTGNHGNGDYWVVKTDASGNIQWQKTLRGSKFDYAGDFREVAGVGYIVTGTSYSNNGNIIGNHGNADCWIVKLNAVGNIEWQKSPGESNYEEALSICQTTDEGYILAGRSFSNDGNVTGNHGDEDFWIVKLSPEDLSTNISLYPYKISANCYLANVFPAQ